MTAPMFISPFTCFFCGKGFQGIIAKATHECEGKDKIRRIKPPLFKISNVSPVPLTQVRERRFGLSKANPVSVLRSSKLT